MEGSRTRVGPAALVVIGGVLLAGCASVSGVSIGGGATGRHLFVVASNGSVDQLVTVDLHRHTIVSRVDVNSAGGVAAQPHSSTVWLLGELGVEPFRPGTKAPGKEVLLDSSPQTMAFSPDGLEAWVSAGTTVYGIDTRTGQIEKDIPLGTESGAAGFTTGANLALSPGGSNAVFTDGDGHLIPINLQTGTVGAPIDVPEADSVQVMGNSAWVGGPDGIWLVNLSTGTIEIYDAIANQAGETLSANGQVLYVTTGLPLLAALCQGQATTSSVPPAQGSPSTISAGPCPPPPPPSPLPPTVTVRGGNDEPMLIALNAQTGAVEWSITSSFEPVGLEATRHETWLAGTDVDGDAAVVPVDLADHRLGEEVVVETPQQFPFFPGLSSLAAVAGIVVVLLLTVFVVLILVLVIRKPPDRRRPDDWGSAGYRE